MYARVNLGWLYYFISNKPQTGKNPPTLTNGALTWGKEVIFFMIVSTGVRAKSRFGYKIPLVFVLALILLTAWSMPCLAAVSVAKAADNPDGNGAGSVNFPQTGHSVSGKFLAYWQNHGGLAIFGYPLTDPTMEIDPATGKTYLTQWFERNTFQLHPEFAGTPYEVELGLLGNQVTAPRRESSEAAFNRTDDAHYPGGSYFSVVGHNLRNLFKDYWNVHGGLAIFGYPISEEFQEVNPSNGQTYLVQYFERNRFEYHPAFKGTPYEVELGLLGDQLVGTRRVNTNVGISVFVSVSGVGGLAVDGEGNVYVSRTQTDSKHLAKYDATGKLLANWGDDGTGDGQLRGPQGVALDNSGRVYVADTLNNRVQKFDKDGNSLGQFGSYGKGNGQFNGPRGVAVDRQGDVYVADTGNQRIEVFNSAGQYLTGWGSLGTGPGQFGQDLQLPALSGPNYLAVDGANHVYATDGANNRIEKFSASGKFLYQLTTQYPSGLATDSQDQLYVGLSSGLRLFDKNGKLLNDFGAGGQNGDSTNITIAAMALEPKTPILYLADSQQIYRVPQG